MTFDFPIATSIVLGDIAKSTGPVTVTNATTFTSGFDGTLTDLLYLHLQQLLFEYQLPKLQVLLHFDKFGAGSEGHFAGLTTIATGGSLTNPAKAIDFQRFDYCFRNISQQTAYLQLHLMHLQLKVELSILASCIFFRAPLVTSAALITTSTATVSIEENLSSFCSCFSGTINGLTVLLKPHL